MAWAEKMMKTKSNIFMAEAKNLGYMSAADKKVRLFTGFLIKMAQKLLISPDLIRMSIS